FAELRQRLLQSADRSLVRSVLGSLLPELVRGHYQRRQSMANSGRQPPLGGSRQLLSKPRNIGHGAGLLPLLFAATDTEPESRSQELWLQVWRDDASQDDRQELEGFDADSVGVGLGFSQRLTDALGLSLGVARTDADLDGGFSGEDEVRSLEFSTSLSWSLTSTQSLSLRYAYTDHDTERRRLALIPFAGELRRVPLLADITASQQSVSLLWSQYYLANNGIGIAPFIDLNASRLSTDDYLERGNNDFALAVTTEDETQLVGSVGISVDYSRSIGSWFVLPSLNLSYSYALDADSTRTLSSFRSFSQSFDASGYDVAENRFQYGAGVRFLNAGGLVLAIDLQFESYDDYDQRAVLAGISLPF
ncbi:MAG: autotransporter outer membrane beta-barrel domain-containing protein, partial [Pseudomonadales bacterium]